MPLNKIKTIENLNIVYSGKVSGILYDKTNSSGSSGQILTSTLDGVQWSSATANNIASSIVSRDASGNFSAGTITATLSGTSTQVSNSLTFNNSGSGAASGITFNGSTAQTISHNTIGAIASTGGTATNLTLSGTLNAGGGNGSSGQVLTSTGTGVQWSSAFVGATVSDDTTTNATRYLVFEDITSGSSSTVGVSSTKLTFNPSTGTLSAIAFSGSGASLTSLTAGNLSGTIPSTVLGNSSLNIGTTSVALNRASANLALTGISSIALPGATSGTVTLQPAATAGTTTITLPATTGTVVTTGDTGTVTNTMLAGSIANAKLANSTISGVALGSNLNTLTLNVSGTGLSGSTTYNGSAAATFTVISNATNANTASTIVARDASGNFSAGTITTSNLVVNSDGSTLYGPNTGWSQYLRVGGNGNADTTNASVVTTNGNLHLDSKTGAFSTYLNYYKGTGGIAFGNGASSAVAWMGPDGDLWKGGADNTGDKYWHAGNDGAGSGLDADLLDGLNAATSNAASTIVARDASGNFSAGTITATTFSGSGASLTNLPAGQLSGTIPSAVLGNSSVNIGTTSIALNRASANLALTGISSIALPGATSGTVTLQPAATAGTTTITLPATTGTVVTTGDSGTVTGTMIANTTIAVGKLSATGTANSTTFLRGDNTWATVSGGVTVSDDTTTNATRYLVFEDVTSGSSSTIGVSSTKLTFNPSTGNLVVGGTITASSDISLKRNIKTIPNALNKVLSLRGVEFKFKKNNEKSIGVIAQEVEKVFPELVKDNQGVKSVAYQNMIGILIEAIKEQNSIILGLKSEIEEIKKWQS